VILQNLIGNAIKYTPRGAVRVIVEAPSGDRGVRIAVEDQGPGIAPESLANLFEPFQRGETHGQPASDWDFPSPVSGRSDRREAACQVSRRKRFDVHSGSSG